MTCYNRFKNNRFGFGGFLALRLELAVDGDVRILVETGIAFHAVFGLRAAFDDRKIMVEEAHAPCKRLQGMVVLDGVSQTLRLFDQLAVGYTGFGPVGREMVRIEFEESFAEARRAYDDAFFVVPAFFPCVHRAPQGFHSHAGMKIVHTPFVRRGRPRK